MNQEIGFKVPVVGLGSNAFSRVADGVTSILAFDEALCVGVSFVGGKVGYPIEYKQGGRRK